ncbi:MAG: hypothetical protein ACI8U3_002589 [Brevundimonas sp.]|jgi:hypothetical protein
MFFVLLTVLVSSSIGLAVCTIMAEVFLARSGIPIGNRIITFNSFRLIRRIIFYFGEHEKISMAHKSILWARLFAMAFFLSFIAIIAISVW